jgi:tetratricopeptide (TPR) repeat protein
VVLAVLHGSIAHGDVFDHAREDVAMSAEASRLFDEGRAAAKQGDYPAACVLFERSLKIERAIGTQLNYADCLEKTQQLRRAREDFIEVQRLATEAGQQDRATFARDRILSLEARLAKVVIRVADPTAKGLVILVDNRPVPVKGLIAELSDPGSIEVIASTTEGRHVEKVTLVGGETTVVEIPRIVRRAPVDDDDRSSQAILRAELALGSMLAGFHVGSRGCTISGCDSPLLPLVATSIGLFTASLLVTKGRELQPGQAQLYNSAQTWAIWNSVLVIYDRGWTDEKEAAFGLGAHAVGFAGGLALWPLWRPSAGDVALTNTFLLWGTAFTYFGYNRLGDHTDPRPAILVGDAALVLGAALSTKIEVSRSTLFVIDVVGALGTGIGGLTLSESGGRDSTPRRTALGFIGGAAVGLTLATLWVWRSDDASPPAAVTLTPMHNGVGVAGSF